MTEIATACCALAIGIAVAAPVGAQVNETAHDDGWILAAAHTEGLEGSIWRTDLWIRFAEEPSDDTSLELYFNESGTDNTFVSSHVVPVTSGKEVYYFEDVVVAFLGTAGEDWLGAIHYLSDLDVQVWARIYNLNEDGTASFGQVVEGVPDDAMSSYTDPFDADEHQWMVALRHTADDRFRVNVGVVNPTGVPTHYLVNIYDATGDRPGPLDDTLVEVDVPPFSMIQLGDPFGHVNGGDWSDFQIRVQTDTPDGGGFAYASVVDNATNDGYFVRGVKTMSASASALD